MDLLVKFWPVGLVLVILVVLKLLFEFYSKGVKTKPNLSVYERKQFLLDTNSEFKLYKILVELLGDKYHIFPQINYSHLIKPRKTNWQDERRYRSSIDRKSADFVFCDKEHVIPKLIIELDGSVHNFRNKQARDQFINELAKIVDLPMLHLKTGNFDREFLRNEINQKLTQK